MIDCRYLEGVKDIEAGQLQESLGAMVESHFGTGGMGSGRGPRGGMDRGRGLGRGSGGGTGRGMGRRGF